MIVFNSLPVSSSLRVTSKFGIRNTGIKGASRKHLGIDVGKDRNKDKTYILAVKSGTILLNSFNRIRGWMVVIKHNEKYSTLYQHLAVQSPLPVGTKVEAGDIIGVMGSTGTSSGVHLHFELYENGKAVDPLPFLQNIESEETAMTESEIKDLVKETIKEVLDGKNTKNSAWFKKEFAGKEDEIAKLTDGKRPQGYATREEVSAIVARAKKI